MNVQTKTWPYGTTLRGTVFVAKITSQHSKTAQLVIDERNEGHVLVGNAADFSAVQGDDGTLTFTKGGPTGGYWKFIKDKE